MSTKKILGLRTCIYLVPDIVKAKEWYARAFRVQPYFDEPFYVGFNIGGFELGLQPSQAQMAKGGVCAYWGVEDIQSSFEYFISCGAVEDSKPRDVGGDILVATVRDPWDNIIGLIYNPHFGTDPAPVH